MPLGQSCQRWHNTAHARFYRWKVDAWELLLAWFQTTESEVAQKPKVFKTNCHRLLMDMTGLSLRTVKGWGEKFEEMPKDRLVVLRLFVGLRLACRASEAIGDEAMALIMSSDSWEDWPDVTGQEENDPAQSLPDE